MTTTAPCWGVDRDPSSATSAAAVVAAAVGWTPEEEGAPPAPGWRSSGPSLPPTGPCPERRRWIGSDCELLLLPLPGALGALALTLRKPILLILSLQGQLGLLMELSLLLRAALRIIITPPRASWVALHH